MVLWIMSYSIKIDSICAMYWLQEVHVLILRYLNAIFAAEISYIKVSTYKKAPPKHSPWIKKLMLYTKPIQVFPLLNFLNIISISLWKSVLWNIIFWLISLIFILFDMLKNYFNNVISYPQFLYCNYILYQIRLIFLKKILVFETLVSWNFILCLGLISYFFKFFIINVILMFSVFIFIYYIIKNLKYLINKNLKYWSNIFLLSLGGFFYYTLQIVKLFIYIIVYLVLYVGLRPHLFIPVIFFWWTTLILYY